MNKILKALSVFLFSIMLVACGEKESPVDIPAPVIPEPEKPAPENPDKDTPSLSIFFIGNSFTMDAVTHLPGMLKAAGINTVHLVHMYYGGRLVQQYNSGWKTSDDYTMYECKPGESSWSTVKGKTLEQVATSKEWDIVTIQEHTGSKYAWTWDATAKTHFTQLFNRVKSSQKTDTKIYYILSQAYQDNSKIGSGSTSGITWTDHVGMWDVITAFAKNVMKDVAFDGIISTGAMLENLRTTSLNNDLGLTRDGYHMDNGISRYGASCTVFESLITPVFNINLDNNTYRFKESGTGTTPVTDTNAPIALQAARNAIKNPYTITDMSSVK